MKQVIAKVPQLPQKINWFPGHMHKALKELEGKTADIDVFLEVRDARLPYSTRNSQFDLLIKSAQKKKIIVFNKFDLCDQTKTKKIIDDYNSMGIMCYYMSAKTHQNMKSLVTYIKDSLPGKYRTVGTWLMICGMPNVGKSTIINQIRSTSDLEKRTATAKATPTVCTTKSFTGIKINESPLMYLVDSPGVMVPSNISDDIGLKLGLLGMIRDVITDKQILIEYMIELFNSQNNDRYYTTFKIGKPSDTLDYLLKVRRKFGFHNYEGAWTHILDAVRDGSFGPITFDIPEEAE